MSDKRLVEQYDGDPPVYVWEQDRPDPILPDKRLTCRWMDFGTPLVQTVQGYPLQPVPQAHQRYLLQALVFHGAPQSVLLLGLGGGTMARWIARHVPGARLVAVEQDRRVIAAAYEHFDLPFRGVYVVWMDAAAWMERNRTDMQQQFDVILVDLFHAMGQADCCLVESFWQDVSAAMHPRTILACNTWFPNRVRTEEGMVVPIDTRSLYQAQADGVQKAIASRGHLREGVYSIRCEDGNRILYGGDVDPEQWDDYTQRSVQWQRRTGLALPLAEREQYHPTSKEE